ncbi:MAG: Dabb family protein [Cyclobacteriaceae bacterium]|nr:Dabb family protein [Cyclobacteriaceae bacterium]
MKKYLLILLWLVASAALSLQARGQSHEPNSRLLKHVLVATFRQGLPADSIKAVDNACLRLSRIPVIKSFEMGSVKPKKEGGPVQRIYVFSLLEEKDLDVYHQSKEHQDLVDAAAHRVETVQVIDYWSEH